MSFFSNTWGVAGGRCQHDFQGWLSSEKERSEVELTPEMAPNGFLIVPINGPSPGGTTDVHNASTGCVMHAFLGPARVTTLMGAGFIGTEETSLCPSWKKTEPPAMLVLKKEWP